MNSNQSPMIIEGFICPECQKDMSNIELLQVHFELMHSKKTLTSSNFAQDNSDSNRSTFSTVLAKAKTLISSSFEPGNPFVENETIDSADQVATNNSPPANSKSLVTNLVLKQYFNSNQLTGCFNSYTDYFKNARDHTVGRYVIQTNKLLITLDKLISIDLNALDDNKREAHFKSVVPWVQDVDVKLCPNCAKTFNLINRKHHCRLCGAIMCNKCSSFLSFALAKNLTDPDTFIQSLKDHDYEQQPEFKLRRSESINSVNSYFFKSNSSLTTSTTTVNDINKKKLNLEQIYLRLCINCSELLEKKLKSLKDKMLRPTFVNIYDKLHFSMNESKRLYPIYTKMTESLNAGEAMYQLKNAEEMRLKLVKYFQQIEVLSAQILNHEIYTTNKDQLKLQRNIRFQSINFLKEYSFTLGQIPTSEVYSKLKAQRETNLQEEMRRAELKQLKQKQEINKRLKKIQLKNQPSNVTVENGWMPTSAKSKTASFFNDSESDNEDDEEDTLDLDEQKLDRKSQKKALRIQIQLVEKYLEEARKQNKHDEVSILQQNLSELLNSLVDC